MSTVMNERVMRHRITVDEFLRMDEAGVFAPDARLELIDGEIIDMGTMGVPHASTIIFLNRLFMRGIPESEAMLLVQLPVRLTQSSLPLPDFALVKPRTDYYRTAHVAPADCLLLVEVSDTSLRYDRDVKAPLYARCGVPEFWIVDVQARRLRVFHTPVAGKYLHVAAIGDPAIVPIRALGARTIDLSELFPNET